MNNTIKNTRFDNLVNYDINQSSSSFPQNFNYNSIDPTALSNLLKGQQLVEYHFVETTESQFVEKK